MYRNSLTYPAYTCAIWLHYYKTCSQQQQQQTQYPQIQLQALCLSVSPSSHKLLILLKFSSCFKIVSNNIFSVRHIVTQFTWSKPNLRSRVNRNFFPRFVLFPLLRWRKSGGSWRRREERAGRREVRAVAREGGEDEISSHRPVRAPGGRVSEIPGRVNST